MKALEDPRRKFLVLTLIEGVKRDIVLWELDMHLYNFSHKVICFKGLWVCVYILLKRIGDAFLGWDFLDDWYTFDGNFGDALPSVVIFIVFNSLACNLNPVSLLIVSNKGIFPCPVLVCLLLVSNWNFSCKIAAVCSCSFHEAQWVCLCISE